MFRWLKSRARREPTLTAALIDIGGMEPGMDESDLHVRREYIREMVGEGKTVEEATRMADCWYIMQVSQQIGGQEAEQKYVPRPLWDGDWAWRQMFSTREEARAHVKHKRGVLIDARTES